jgi:hypothetical protein
VWQYLKHAFWEALKTLLLGWALSGHNFLYSTNLTLLNIPFTPTTKALLARVTCECVWLKKNSQEMQNDKLQVSNVRKYAGIKHIQSSLKFSS